MKSNAPPVVSILTPTWNRADYLPKVWEGLNSQTNRCIEWIVANDGSTDHTVDTVRDLAGQSDFPVTLINASTRIGKSRMDNEAVRCAQGDFILWCDSDDYLLPDAVETLLSTWTSIPTEDREHFAGVAALCETDEGTWGDRYPPDQHTDMELNRLLWDMRTDLVIFTRSSLLKSNPFLEVDYLIPESSVWNAIGMNRTRFIPIPLKRISYGEINCLSYSGLMEYCRGRAYALAKSRKHLKGQLRMKDNVWRMINYLRYCIHGDIGAIKACQIWKPSIFSVVLFLILSPISFSLALKDQIQGKVRKTHKGFLAAKDVVEIDYMVLREMN